MARKTLEPKKAEQGMRKMSDEMTAEERARIAVMRPAVNSGIAAALPVVTGWPRALGCPWCAIRKADGAIPRPNAATYRHEGTRPADPVPRHPQTAGDGLSGAHCMNVISQAIGINLIYRKEL